MSDWIPVALETVPGEVELDPPRVFSAAKLRVDGVDVPKNERRGWTLTQHDGSPLHVGAIQGWLTGRVWLATSRGPLVVREGIPTWLGVLTLLPLAPVVLATCLNPGGALCGALIPALLVWGNRRIARRSDLSVNARAALVLALTITVVGIQLALGVALVDWARASVQR